MRIAIKDIGITASGPEVGVIVPSPDGTIIPMPVPKGSISAAWWQHVRGTVTNFFQDVTVEPTDGDDVLLKATIIGNGTCFIRIFAAYE